MNEKMPLNAINLFDLFVKKPILFVFNIISFIYYLMSIVLKIIINYLFYSESSTGQIFRFAHELDRLNKQSHQLRQEYEFVNRKYLNDCEKIKLKRMELEKRKDEIIRHLNSIGFNWSISQKEIILFNLTSTKQLNEKLKVHPFEMERKNIHAKQMAKLFDKKFAPLNNTTGQSSKNLEQNFPPGHLFCPININNNNKMKLDIENVKLRKMCQSSNRFDQLANLTLHQFGNDIGNCSLKKSIIQLYKEPEWQPLIELLRKSYHFFPYLSSQMKS